MYIAVNGRRVHFIESGAGSALLLIHGLGASTRSWSATVERLADAYRVIAVDLPGFGLSEKPPVVPNMTFYADVVIAVMNALELKEAYVVGHSMGGIVAQCMAINYPERVRKLILVASGDLQVSCIRKTLMGLAFHAAPLVGALPRLRPFLGRGRWIDRAICDFMVSGRDSIPVEAMSDLILGLNSPGFAQALSVSLQDQTYRELAAIESPTTVLQGGRDRLVPPTTGRRLARRIQGSSLVIWRDAGHCPMLESPSGFARFIRGVCV